MTYVQLIACPYSLLHLLLQLCSQNFTSSLPPARLLKLVLHRLNLRVLFLQNLPHSKHVARHFGLLLPHVVFYKLLALLKHRVEDLQDFVSHGSELIAESLTHFAIEGVELKVDIRDFP